MDCSTPGFPVFHYLPELAQTQVHWVSDAIQPSHPLSSPIFPSTRVFSNELALHIRWPDYWSFSFSISPFNEHPGLISFRMDWLDLLAVQGILKSLLQHHNSKASVLQHSAFFIVQFSHPYMTTGKTIALTRWTFVDKVTSVLLNMLSRLVISFLPRSKCLLISWLQSPFAVILEPPKIKSDTLSTVSPSISHEVMWPDATKQAICLVVKSLPSMQETWDWSLGREHPLETEMATQSSILAWKIPWTEEPGGLQSMGSEKSWTQLSD